MKVKTQVQLPNCRQCPSNQFRMPYVMKSRFMGICDAKHLVLRPVFPEGELRDSQFISRANVQIVQFETPDNCPHLEQLRKEGKIEWAMSSIDFRGRSQFY